MTKYRGWNAGLICFGQSHWLTAFLHPIRPKIESDDKIKNHPYKMLLGYISKGEGQITTKKAYEI